MLYNLELILNRDEHQLLVLDKISNYGLKCGQQFENYKEWELFKKESIKNLIDIDVDVHIKRCFHLDSIEFLFDIYYKNMIIAKDCSNLIDYLEIKKAIELCDKFKISEIKIIDDKKIIVYRENHNLGIESPYFNTENRNKIIVNDVLIEDIAIELAKRMLEGNSYD